MKVKYVKHSCYIIELYTSVLIFDYYSGKIPALPTNKDIFVFASHFHHDHFDMKIFELTKHYPKIHYILSKDISRKFNRRFFLTHGVSPELYDAIIFVPCGLNEPIYNINIETLKSTDEGVAFIITTEGLSIYHAGDLNLWLWKDEKKINNMNMKRRFFHEMEYVSGRHFDVAFLPLDPRLEEAAYTGFDFFMKHTDTDNAYPMHCWGDKKIISNLINMDFALEYKDRIVDLIN